MVSSGWWLAYLAGLGYDVTENCSDCNGEGGTPYDGPCPSCYGQGVVPVASHKEE